MKTRKRSRQTTVLASLAACCLPLATAATTPADAFSWNLPSATNDLKKVNPKEEDLSWWTDDAGGSDDENESGTSSDDDEYRKTIHDPLIDGPVAFETTSISYSTVPGSINNTSSKRRRHSFSGSKTQERIDKSDSLNSASYESMKTLDRLQQMLDDTDYITRSRSHSSHRSSTAPGASDLQQQSVPHPMTAKNQEDSLWTSKDRSKYKKQQRKMREQEQKMSQEQIQPQQQQLNEPLRRVYPQSQQYNSPSSIRRQSPPIHQFTSDDELSEESEDGLGYTLPNLPVYFSDAEGESETEVDSTSPQPESSMNRDIHSLPASSSYIPDEGMARQYPHDPVPNLNYHSDPYQYQQHAQQPPTVQHNPQMYPPPNYVHTYPYPYPSQYYGAQPLPQQQAWGDGAGISPPSYPGTASYVHHTNHNYQPLPQWTPPVPGEDQTRRSSHSPTSPSYHLQKPQSPPSQTVPTTMFPLQATHTVSKTNMQHSSTVALSEQTRTRSLNVRSMQQISLVLAVGSLACFVAVSPRTLPFDEYRLRVIENLQIVSLATIFPAVNMALVYDGNMNNLNEVINTFFASCSLGYTMAFASEILLATFIRLGVFSLFEKGIFYLSPRIPVFILPWVLRENGYRPKRITLFAADFLTSCVASPVVEEFFKLKILQWSTELPRNFNWVNKSSKSRNGQGEKRSQLVAEPVLRRPGEVDVVNANQFVTHMLAASLGLKLCDSVRRILLYTKSHHESKSFFAFCRGVFPIHELCGTMTALGLAKRDLLGVEMPLWKILLPSVVVHGMANFRGMKPIFKWNSSTPWSEMQLYPLAVDSTTSLPHLLKKAYPKLVWLVILSRVFGYCVKNYFMVNRQARKRTTTYAGKHAAFSAELATAELLKKK